MTNRKKTIRYSVVRLPKHLDTHGLLRECRALLGKDSLGREYTDGETIHLALVELKSSREKEADRGKDDPSHAAG